MTCREKQGDHWYSHALTDPAGSQPIHDDRLLSLALIAHLDHQLQAGHIRLGSATSAIIDADDPLDHMEF